MDETFFDFDNVRRLSCCHWSRAARPNRLSWAYFNVLTGQGANAPSGAARYIVHGKMIGGFD